MAVFAPSTNSGRGFTAPRAKPHFAISGYWLDNHHGVPRPIQRFVTRTEILDRAMEALAELIDLNRILLNLARAALTVIKTI